MSTEIPVVIVCDLETTGITDPIGACQVAAVMLVPDTSYMHITPLFQTYCYPSQPMSQKALETHGITAEMYEFMPSDFMAAWLLVQAIEGVARGRPVILGGYNSTRYDYPILDKLCPSPVWSLPKLDAMHACIRRDDGQSYKLVDAFEQEGLGQSDTGQRLLSGAHDAMADCWMTAMVLRHFMGQLEMANPQEMADFMSTPQVLNTMPHGKFRGTLFKDVRADYLSWAAGAWNDMVPDLEHTFKHYGLK